MHARDECTSTEPSKISSPVAKKWPVPKYVAWLADPFASGHIEFILDSYTRLGTELLKECADEMKDIETPAKLFQDHVEKFELVRIRMFEIAQTELDELATQCENEYRQIERLIDNAWAGEPDEETRESPQRLQWEIQRWRNDPRKFNYVKVCQYFLDRHQRPVAPKGLPSGFVALPQKEKSKKR
jgi:hypothetical protein